MWYPDGTQNFIFEKFKVSAFQRRVDRPLSFLLSKITAREKCIIFLKFQVFLRISTFGVKIVKNSQTSKHSTNRTRSHTQPCDTAFESWDIILFSPRNFGYHWGTHGTQKIQFRFYLEKLENLANPAHKWHFREEHGTPMVPKILFSESSRSQLSNAVSTVPLGFLDQKLQPEEKKRR